MMNRITVLIPTYNERENIPVLTEEIFYTVGKYNYELHILFIDDKSPDGTAEEVKRIGEENRNVHLLSRSGKLGIGSAYLDGFRWATEHFLPDVFIQMDADLSHPPSALPLLVESVLGGNDVALGSRYIESGGSTNWGWHRKIISKGANWLVRNVLGIKGINDLTTGYRALNKKAVETILNADLSNEGYAYQVESLLSLSRIGYTIKEIPIVFKGRVKGKTKLSITEILRFAWTVFKTRFSK
jgi:dolichol-phosphate mannosyltransferase